MEIKENGTPLKTAVTVQSEMRFKNVSFIRILLAKQHLYDILEDVMGSAYTNINIHIIFHIKSTHNCQINEADLPRIYQYIGGVIRTLDGYPYMIGGRPDHLHILTSVPPKSSLSDFVRTIKASSSKWIKNIGDAYQFFAWQEGYGAFSVSKSNTHAVMDYIMNQEQHHRTYSAQEEFQQFLNKHGILSSAES